MQKAVLSMAKYPDLYEWSLSEAEKLGHVHFWRDSYKENCDCARSIEKGIRNNYDGMHLNSEFMSNILEQYGFNRVNFVLANTIKYKSDDGRFSQENREWADRFYVPQDEVQWHFAVDSHPGLVDLCVNQVRKQWQDKGFFDKSHCVSGENIDYEDKLLVLKPTALTDEYQKPEFQLFYATSGFGCQPEKTGRKVSGFYLIDDTTSSISRERFYGVIRDECIPDWAKEKLEQINSDESEIIAIGGMQQ